MKTTMIKSAAVVLVAFVTMSFTTIKKEVKPIKTEESNINWVGKKVTGQHSGTIGIKEGGLEFKKDKLVGGSIVVDMSSIEVTDLEGDYKNKLEGHLKADDFFGTDNFKTATLVFTKVEAKDGKYQVTGDFTIKGITESIQFDLNIEGNKATSSLKINRTKFGIKYGSSSFFDGLKDKAIYDDFELEVTLVF
jgi:polyisoprenoid-binding protein YceI